MLYSGVDGTGVPVRPGETGGRTGKADDGKAGTREVKLARFFTVSRLDADGRPVMDPGSSTYAATSDGKDALAELAGLVVSGVSGAGKSSLLQAGMLPAIRGTGLASVAGSARWPCLVFTPTRAPLDKMALRVALLAGADAAAVRRGLDADPDGFALTARQAALASPPGPGPDPDDPAADRHQPPRLLLAVDQFEQLFTQCADEEQRRTFITALSASADTGHGPDHTPAALAVLGVRADFEARCADYPQLADAIQNRYLVTSMTERQPRMAITQPARTAGSRVDDDLVQVLLANVRTRQPGIVGAGVLPLLSHALDQAWRSRAGARRTWLIAASVSHDARFSSRVRSGVRSPACSAIVHPFRFGRSLTAQTRTFLACCHVSVRANHGLSAPISSARSRTARPTPIRAAAAAFDSFVCEHMIVKRLRSRHTNPPHPAWSSRQWRLPL